MKPQILRGSKEEIAQGVARIAGDVREAIVFVDEPLETVTAPAADDLFAEMAAFEVRASGADYSRPGIYAPTEGE